MQAEPIPTQLEQAECERHLRELNSYKRNVREAGLRQVSGLPPAQLLQLMQKGAHLYGKRYRLSSYVELILLSLSVGIGMALFAVFGNGVVGWLLLWMLFSALGWHFLTVPWRMYRALGNLLEHTEDLNLIGLAISMYVRPEGVGRTHIILGKTLCRLLPQLRSNHANLLTADQKQDLILLLSMCVSAENAAQSSGRLNSRALPVMLQALKALEQISDASAIPAVQSIVTSPTLSKNEELRQAAVDCLEYLRIHAGRNREMQTLLRASSVANPAPDILLRPASGNDTTASEQLLRPQI